MPSTAYPVGKQHFIFGTVHFQHIRKTGPGTAAAAGTSNRRPGSLLPAGPAGPRGTTPPRGGPAPPRGGWTPPLFGGPPSGTFRHNVGRRRVRVRSRRRVAARARRPPAAGHPAAAGCCRACPVGRGRLPLLSQSTQPPPPASPPLPMETGGRRTSGSVVGALCISCGDRVGEHAHGVPGPPVARPSWEGVWPTPAVARG